VLSRSLEITGLSYGKRLLGFEVDTELAGAICGFGSGFA
jgi:hypothetical protein